MVAVALALLAALSYGASDYVGGILSKSRSSWMVAMASQLVAAVVTAVVALALSGSPGPADFGWAAAGGVGEAVGIASLYYGLARGRMGVVAPISGTGAALVPVVVGVATGDQPSLLAWIGIALAFPAVYFIPRAPGSGNGSDGSGNGLGTGSGGSGGSGNGGVTAGVLAGLGFGAQFAFVGQVGAAAGYFPFALLWVVSAATVIVVASVLRRPWVPRRGARLGPVLAFGPVSAVAVVAFHLAAGQGLLTVVSVIAALYPAITVAMAAVLLRERIGRQQALGLALAAVTVVLVTVGR